MDSHHTGHRSQAHMIYTIALIGFIFTMHMVIPMYSNSSFLSLFVDEKTLGYIYMCGAAVTMLAFMIAPALIRRIGNYKTALWLVVAQIALYSVLVYSDDPVLVIGAFILQSAMVAIIALSMDIFLEIYTDGGDVGRVRGLYTATLNASWVVAPLIGALLINGSGNFRHTYLAGLAMLIPLLYLMHKNFPRFHDPNYLHITPLQLVKHVANNRNWTWLFVANTVLQVFYAWMVVYSPIYLNKTVGFGWESIGIIVTIMLLPFALIQYPLGKISDKLGEKMFMIFGFALMGISTAGLAFISSKELWVWAAALFVTRIGAAAAEIMLESYFFKTVSVRDSAALGMFRMTRPLSYFIAPIITTVGLLFTTHEYLFVVIGAFTLLAVIPASRIRDRA